jgi:hypothetical protein
LPGVARRDVDDPHRATLHDRVFDLRIDEEEVVVGMGDEVHFRAKKRLKRGLLPVKLRIRLIFFRTTRRQQRR